MDLETEKFTYYLDECYFHPERNKEVSTETEKLLARKSYGVSLEQTQYNGQRDYIRKSKYTVKIAL